MPIDYAQITEDNITEYGRGIRRYGPTLLANLYSDRTHFIYELLQNAEDAKASWVDFKLFRDRIEARHDGRPFNEDDVRGICGLGKGTKADDLTQIGKFGIGFKSVYAYTKAPQVHSVDEAFCIENYVHPHAIAPVELADRETLFVFPFDHADVPADVAFVEIDSRLNDLGVRTLLFLRHIKQITWRIEDGREGDYLREAKEITEHTRRVYVLSKIGDQEDQEEEWLVLSRPLNHPNHPELKVEVAFRVDLNTRGDIKRIIAAPNATLVAFFPTEKETRLQFLLQGPYRTTPARDNIPSYDQWNRTLIQETATLVADAIVQIKGMGLLTVGFLETLPISSGDFPEGFMFRPIYESVRTTLGGEEALLPAAGGDYVNAEQAVLARGRDLIALLSAEQLALLFEKPTGQWLDAGITADRTSQLREYLMDELKIPEADAERFARQFNEDFIKAQDDKWVARFYVFLSGRSALLRKPEYRDSRWPSRYRREQSREAGLLYAQPIIRLSDDQHASPFDEHGEPSAYLPGRFESSYPTVKRTVLRNAEAKRFLTSLGFTALDTYEEVMEKILPKYEQNSSLPERREVLADNRKIAHALETASSTKRNALVERITALPILFAQKRSGEVRLYSPDSGPYLSSKHTGSHELEEFLQRIGVVEDAPFVDPWYLKIYDVDTLTEMGCIGALDAPKEVARHILSKYTADKIKVSGDENLRDVKVIAETMVGIESWSDQPNFREQLKGAWFVFGKNAGTGKTYRYRPEQVHLGKPYTGNEDIEVYFSGNSHIHFLDEMYMDSLSTDELALLGCQSEIRIRYRRPSSNGHVTIRSKWSEHERGLDGFDPDLEIQGLRHALDSIDETGSVRLARIVWNLAKRHPQGIYGTVEWCTRQNFTGHTQKTEKPSSAGKLLRERAWLPDSKGAFHVPSEIRLFDLPDDFDRGSAAARELAVRLGCRPEIDLSQLSQDQRRRFEFSLDLTEDEMEMIKDKRSELAATHGEEEATSEGVHFAEAVRKAFDHSPTGPSASKPRAPGPVPDPDRRRDRTGQDIEAAMAVEPLVWERFRRVPSKRWEGKNYDTRVFLEEQYAGRCQICGHAFTQRNGRPYFEGLYLVSSTKAAWIDRQGNVLCLCANCCAKMRHGTIQAEQDVIEQLQAPELHNREGGGSSAVEFKLCGEPVGLAFTERHIIDVQEMLKVDEAVKGPRQTTD